MDAGGAAPVCCRNSCTDERASRTRSSSRQASLTDALNYAAPARNSHTVEGYGGTLRYIHAVRRNNRLASLSPSPCLAVSQRGR